MPELKEIIMSNRRLKVGLIGYGVAGQNFHAPFIDAHPDMDLAVVVERSSEKARERYPYIEIVKDASSIFSNESIGLVVIATPNATHFSLAQQALQAGKHVVIDKPFVPTATEGAILIELAAKQNKILTVFQNRRWDGGFLTVKDLIEKEILGHVVEYEAHFDRFRNVVNLNAWKEKEQPGSGILFDLGSHLIDQALVLFGLPLSIIADVRSQRPGALVDDYFELNLMYENLKVTLKAGVLVKEPSPVFIVHGTKGSYVKYGLDPQEAALKQNVLPDAPMFGYEEKAWWGKLNTEIDGLEFAGPIETLPGSYKSFYENIYDSIMNGTKIAVKPSESLDVIRIIELARQSVEERRYIDL